MAVRRVAAACLGVALACALLGGWLALRSARAEVETLRAAKTALGEDLARAMAANAAQRSVIREMEQLRGEHENRIAGAMREIAQKDARARYLDKQLRKAANAQHRGDSILSSDESFALCLRWLAAEGRLPLHYLQPGAGGAPAGGDDRVAAFCAAWDGTTAEDVMAWAGSLLDQAGRQTARSRAARGE